MSWIAELDTQGREFPTCVHVTKTTNTMIHGATYVPIEEGKAVRAENAKLREELSKWERLVAGIDLPEYPVTQFKPKDLERENAKLRELVRGLQYCAHEAYGMCARVPVGGERPFTCCPLYDFDAKEYRCEKLMLDLGVGVDG